MHILLTRPLEDSHELILRFQKLGHDISHMPLIKIEKKNHEDINFGDYNAHSIGIILLWLSAFLTLYTGYEYLRKGIDHAISEDSKN